MRLVPGNYDMSNALQRKPLLQPRHFDGLVTQLSPQGLRFSFSVGPGAREGYAWELEDSMVDVEGFLARLAARRPFSKVALNPRRPSARALATRLRAAQSKELTDEPILVTYGLNESYDRKWERTCDKDGFDSEGQHLVLVAYDPVQPVGYNAWGVGVVHDSEDRRLFLSFTLELVYVIPSRRGEGFGFDLALACGWVSGDVLEAVYRAARPGTTISSLVYADYESQGGEALTRHVKNSLEISADMLRETGKRRSVIVEYPDLDAGY
jgi:GNAT superfamily N-acetyltransferase